MKKIIYISAFTFMLTSTLSFGQNVGINLTGATPNSSSMLDVVSSTKGLLIPRVSLSATISTSPILPAPGAAEDGLMVYNTATAGDVTPGYYYWNGVGLNWVRMLNGGSTSSAWQITGNTATNPITNFAGTIDAKDFVIRTSNTERMRVLSNGDVGIGTSAPYNSKLEVKGRISSVQAGEASFHLYNGGAIEEWVIRQLPSGGDGTDNSFHIQTLNGATYTDAIVVSAYSLGSASLRYVGINCSDPKYQLHVNGNCGVNGTIFANVAAVSAGVVACSDIRYKKNIATLPNALDNIMKLRGVSYNWKKEEFPDKNFNDDKQVGVIAQELEKIYPELVMTDKDGYKSVDYSRLTPILIEAVKEQQKTIANIEAENKNLKANCINSETRILKLEAAVEKLAQPKYKEEAKK